MSSPLLDGAGTLPRDDELSTARATGSGPNPAQVGTLTDRVERRMGVFSARGGNEPYLDGVRALAVLAIVFLHTWGNFGEPAWRLFGHDVTFIPANSRLGVDLFFLLSGFLLARPWFRSEAEGTARPHLKTFWRRRLYRIVPAYYLSLIVVLLLFVPTGPISQASITGEIGLWNLGAHALFLHSYVPLSSGFLYGSNDAWWSLSVEMTWYLVLPLFALAFLGKRWRIALPVALAVTVAWIALSLYSFDGVVEAMANSVSGATGTTVGLPRSWSPTMRDILLIAFPTFTFTFALGVGLAKMVVVAAHRSADTPPWWAHPRTALAVFCIGIVLTLVVITTHWRFSGQLQPDLRFVGSGSALALLLYGVTFGPPALRRPLEWLPLRYIGWVSYGIYLFHIPVLTTIRTHSDITTWSPKIGVPVLFAIGLTLTTLVATASWLLIERPFLQSRPRPRRAQPLHIKLRPSARVLVAMLLAVSAVGTYLWVTGPGDRSPWSTAEAAHQRDGVDVVPVLRPIPGAGVSPASGAATVAQASERGVITGLEANLIAECGANTNLGSTFMVASAEWDLHASAFTCRDRAAANQVLAQLAQADTAAGLREMPQQGEAPIKQFFADSNPSNPSHPVRLNARYLHDATVIGLTLQATSESSAIAAADKALDLSNYSAN